ncbi:MAG: [FeFe] hydrogenase H-cluster maturation GTPase HydF [bacterium]
MNKTPKGYRLHIGIFGRRNVGKSSVLNAITSQQVSIVSDVAGTTTDPVEKPMELLPLGPVLFIDTAGVDDEGMLGDLRVQRTKQVLERTDLGLIITEGRTWGSYEQTLAAELKRRKVTVLVIFNKSDVATVDADLMARLLAEGIRSLAVSARTGAGIQSLRRLLVELAPEDFIASPKIAGDLVPPGDCAVLVVPVDKEAPKGRLILPQVQTIRDLLDNDSYCLVVKERELREALGRLNRPPALVVTDSQAFLKVAADTPESVPLTSFSILFARFHADLDEMVRGALAIAKLKGGDHVLIAEACSHHPIGEDIGTIKIPRWLTQYVGGKLEFEYTRGHDFPADLAKYKLIIHCGACMWNRREMLSRHLVAREAGVPMTNYGLAIAFSLGIFERALRPFPGAYEIYRKSQGVTI